MLICELRIYLNKTRGDCDKTSQDGFEEFYYVYVLFECIALEMS